MKAQPLIISLTVLLTTLVPATSHALDATARDEQLGDPSPLTVVTGGLIIDGTGAQLSRVRYGFGDASLKK